MLHKCANPACPIPFRKLSHGKLFLVETEPLGVSELRRGRDEASLLIALNTTGCARSVRSPWLCRTKRGEAWLRCSGLKIRRRGPRRQRTREVSSNASRRTEQSA